uniref:(northern house mosquito) hypothetical protein n=1 Tax=Culex pipiens TaxID=7175 RepID=A0A8D8DD38_CULPI
MHNCFVLLSLSLDLSEYILNISLIISCSSQVLACFWVRFRSHPAPSLSFAVLLSKNPVVCLCLCVHKLCVNCNANYKLKISPFVVLLRLSLRPPSHVQSQARSLSPLSVAPSLNPDSILI